MTKFNLKLTSTLILLSIFSAMFTFWLYSGMRSLSEVIGTHLGVTLYSAVVAFLFLVPLIALALAIMARLLKQIACRQLIVFIMISGGLVGIVLGESAMLIDEASFRREVKQAETSGLNQYGRSRAWPNGAASLVWNRNSGIHATD
jgi:hypothetical protein